MDTEIAVALLALLGSLAGTFSGIFVNARLVNYRLSQLERKVDRQCEVVERVVRLEQEDAVKSEALRSIRRRVGELEAAERGYEPPLRRADE